MTGAQSLCSQLAEEISEELRHLRRDMRHALSKVGGAG
jgi:hypothetical protein